MTQLHVAVEQNFRANNEQNDAIVRHLLDDKANVNAMHR
jgi:hypothetical protein